MFDLKPLMLLISAFVIGFYHNSLLIIYNKENFIEQILQESIMTQNFISEIKGDIIIFAFGVSIRCF